MAVHEAAGANRQLFQARKVCSSKQLLFLLCNTSDAL